MRKLTRPPCWLVVFLYVIALILLSWLIVRFNWPDSLLLLFMAPCVLLAFFYGRRVYGSMIVLVVATAIWATSLVSSSFITSLITIAVAATSAWGMAEMVRLLTLSRARAQEALHRQSEESRLLAEMGMALLDCDQAEHVFEVLGAFLAQTTTDVIIIINQATPDQQSLITRHLIGLEGTLWAQAEKLVGFQVIGKASPIVQKWRDYFFQNHLLKIPGGFSMLAASEIPETIGKILEKLCGLHETFTIGIADHNTLWGNVHFITRRADVSLPVHLIEAVTYQCFITLSRIHAMQELATSNKMLEQTSRMARVGGWEKNLLSGDDRWSAITKEIHEVPDDFIPSMQNAIQFYKEGPSRDKIVEVVNRAIEHGEPYDVELQIVTAKGNERWVRTMGFPKFQDGQCVHLYGVFQDVDEQVRAKIALRENQALLKQTIQTLQDQERFTSTLNDVTRTALESYDLEDMLQTLADRMGELFQADGCYLTLWDEEAQTTMPGAAYGAWRDRYHTVKLEPDEPTVTTAVLRAGRPIAIEDVYDTPYLSRRIAELFPDRSLLGLPLVAGERKLGAALIAYNEAHQFTPLEIARGEQVGGQIALAVARALLYQDLQAYAGQLEARVQERTAELQAQYAQLDAILRSVSDAIFMTDSEQHIQYINPAFTTLTGYPADEVLGQTVYALEALVDFSSRLPSIMPTLTQGKLWQGDVRVQRKDGRRYDATLIIAPVYDDAEQIQGRVFTHRDISQARKLERAQAQFIGNVSHQFRTPLTLLKTSIYLLIREPVERQVPQLQAMEDAINWLIQLVQDTLEISALDSGKGFEVWEPLSFPDIVRETLNRHQVRARETGLILEAAPIPPLPPVQGDANRLAQALGELVENAVIFTPAGGQVTVTVDVRADRWIAITVQDTGPGLTDEELPRVFERFFRGRLAESGHIPGVGLGLSIAQKIAEAHGGRITVESTMGEGSAFTLWLRSGFQEEAVYDGN